MSQVQSARLVGGNTVKGLKRRTELDCGELFITKEENISTMRRQSCEVAASLLEPRTPPAEAVAATAEAVAATADTTDQVGLPKTPQFPSLCFHRMRITQFSFNSRDLEWSRGVLYGKMISLFRSTHLIHPHRQSRSCGGKK